MKVGRQYISTDSWTPPVTKSVLLLFPCPLPHQQRPTRRLAPSPAQVTLHDHQLGSSPAGHLGNSHWKMRPAGEPTSMRRGAEAANAEAANLHQLLLPAASSAAGARAEGVPGGPAATGSRDARFAGGHWHHRDHATPAPGGPGAWAPRAASAMSDRVSLFPTLHIIL
nr:uncharacterized protein LOC126523694 isoform X3 [Dermacentor andersoni]